MGDIHNKKIVLSEIGKIAQRNWKDIPKHFQFVELGEYVIMPNHVHGIIIINKHNVETQNLASVQQNHFGPQSQNLASIIRGYKSGVKKYATINNINFVWQPRYYDHIIRNRKSSKRISDYIVNNPLTWNEDEFYKID